MRLDLEVDRGQAFTIFSHEHRLQWQDIPLPERLPGGLGLRPLLSTEYGRETTKTLAIYRMLHLNKNLEKITV